MSTLYRHERHTKYRRILANFPLCTGREIWASFAKQQTLISRAVLRCGKWRNARFSLQPTEDYHLDVSDLFRNTLSKSVILWKNTPESKGIDGSMTSIFDGWFLFKVSPWVSLRFCFSFNLVLCIKMCDIHSPCQFPYLFIFPLTVCGRHILNRGWLFAAVSFAR